MRRSSIGKASGINRQPQQGQAEGQCGPRPGGGNERLGQRKGRSGLA